MYFLIEGLTICASSKITVYNMGYIEYHEKLGYLLELIKRGRLGSPQECAEIFTCSEKTIRNMLNALRSKGLKINYNRSTKKYMLK